MARPNIFTAPCEFDDADPAGFRGGVARVGQEAGGSEITVKVYELPPGEALCPYHYEYIEEWLAVLAGRLELRIPSGVQTLATGELICFPAGPEGAHRVENRSSEPARLMMWSSSREPAVAVYPDSDKIGVWPGRPEDELLFRRSDGNVNYYDGET
jgi:uncharacterized cupin superfamily protein